MIVCPTCGEENAERARFCSSCGAALAAEVPAGEERKVVSVLFVDLVGFTSRSDKADPEDVRATLRPYHERVKADIERFGGTLEKFIGDAVMAVFGAPVAHEDDAERAVRSALRILDSIDELRADGLEIAVRAAVTTGEAVVALGARPERGEGIVTGDVVNVAARLQAAAPVGGVIVDEQTMRSTTDAITYEALEPVSAKGKAEPVENWRAVEARSRVGQPEAATETPFVGRELERTLLYETFLRAEREASVQLVTVVGEPGIGKSRLVTELRATLDDRPDLVTWRHGRCLPYGEGITYWALGEIVKAEAGILESDDREAAASRLAETVAMLFEDAAERAWLETRLGPLVGAGGEGGEATREESFTAWRRFVEALAARRPTVLVVEDLHWADGPLLEFLEHLLDWSVPAPLFLICTARPELYERKASWGGGKRNATTISLSPLSGEEAGRLFQLLLDRTLLPAETQATLLERAGGNPLYAEQFARMLEDRGDVEGLAVPETVHALVAARLDTLRPELKSVLHDAAVVGRNFWSGAVASLGERAPDDVRRDLNELVHREFVRPLRSSSLKREDEFSFWHALVRDVAYQQIPRSPRAEKHLAAAAWVENVAEDRLEDHAEILVHHYGQALELARSAGREAHDVERSLVRVLLLAGDRATHLDTEAAERYFRRAVELAEGELARAQALAKLAPVLESRGELNEAVEAAEAALPALRVHDLDAAAAVLGYLATSAWARGEIASSDELSQEAIGILEREPTAELVQAFGHAAHRAAIGGRFEEAEVHIVQGFALAEQFGVENVIALLNARATVRGYNGDPACLDDVREAIEVGRRLGRGRGTAVSMNNLGDGLAHFVGMREARAQWDEAIEFSTSRGLGHPAMWQRGERLRALFHLGDWDELRREANDVIRWERERRGGQLELFGLIHLAGVRVHQGEHDEAAADVDALLPRARESGDPQVLVPGLSVAALVAAAAGDRDRALLHVRELEEQTRGSHGFRSYGRLSPSRIALAAGELELAEAFVEGIADSAAWNRCSGLAASSQLLEARGELDEARARYHDAAEGWEAFGSVVEQAYALIGAGRCGNVAAGREGEAIFERLGASPVLARAA
ncbi:MAG TPA: adenylate/guanylate cyclase domain-containing protein [Gaiellaceae bacterium]|nr:adenylate/guanylate cyclase domain-containing protein [Gaiellaceae bacterium]